MLAKAKELRKQVCHPIPDRELTLRIEQRTMIIYFVSLLFYRTRASHLDGTLLAKAGKPLMALMVPTPSTQLPTPPPEG